MDQNITSKELNPGIVLHKQVFQARPEEPYESLYEFKVELQKLNTLEFTADFTGSKNIEIEGTTGLTKNTVVQAFSTQTVAILKLQRHWVLKSRFRFTIKPAPRSIQETYLRRETETLINNMEKANHFLRSTPVNLSSLQELEQILISQDMNFIDIDFPPVDTSIFKELEGSAPDILVHWRRPKEFMHVNPAERLYEPALFQNKIEPSDILQGQLGDCWFMSALASLAERPELVERLFLNKTVNQLGIYRVKLCKNGEWVTVTVDDFFPCYPMGQPIFSKAKGNELWVLILEKAYAKLHGHYYSLKGGFAAEGMIDLTGCPTLNYTFTHEDTQNLIQTGEFWLLMQDFDESGYLMAASTQGEDRWNEVGFVASLPNGLVAGHAYTILQCKEIKGYRLLNIRNPWGKIEWRGDWSDGSPLWTQQMKQILNPALDENDGNFWMSYEDFLQNFTTLNICRVKNWDEVRIKGKFIRVVDAEDDNLEIVQSKWYYCFDLKQRTRVFIGVHQEDERITGVALKRPYLDIGITILRRLSDGGIELVANKELMIDRQVELEYSLEPGSYIILPRTSGCLLRRHVDLPNHKIQLLDKNGKLSDLMSSTVDDIFRKFDMLLNRELTFTEFKSFMECLNKNVTESEFKQRMLKKYCSTAQGITIKGFKEYFIDQIQQQGQTVIWQWLNLLGYDNEFNSIKSRCFILTIHSEIELAVTVRDSIQTDLDNRTNVLLIENQGHELEARNNIRCFFHFSKHTHNYTYGILNEQQYPIECTLDCSGSQNMYFSTKGPVVTKLVDPGQMEFMLHTMAIPSTDNFVRSARCSWKVMR